MNFKRLLHSDIGVNFISILLGIGLASLFRRVCKDRKCLKFVAPPAESIDERIFEFDNKCYIFKPQVSECVESKKHVPYKRKEDFSEATAVDPLVDK